MCLCCLPFETGSAACPPPRFVTSAATNHVAQAAAQCNVHDVVFLEAMRHLPGTVDTFEVFFGGSDAVIGSAIVQVSSA
jgi:hypothetical protein